VKWVRRDSRQGTAVLLEEEDRGSIAVDEVGRRPLSMKSIVSFSFQTRRKEVTDLAQKVDNDLVVHRQIRVYLRISASADCRAIASIQCSAHDAGRSFCSSSTSAGSTFRASAHDPQVGKLEDRRVLVSLTATIAFAPSFQLCAAWLRYTERDVRRV